MGIFGSENIENETARRALAVQITPRDDLCRELSTRVVRQVIDPVGGGVLNECTKVVQSVWVEDEWLHE